jgi:hypothetical protein
MLKVTSHSTVRLKGKGKLVLAHSMKASNKSKGTAPHILTLGTTVVKLTPGQFLLRKITPVPLELEAGWAPDPVWTFPKRDKFLVYAGVRNPDRRVRRLVAIPTVQIQNSLSYTYVQTLTG